MSEAKVPVQYRWIIPRIIFAVIFAFALSLCSCSSKQSSGADGQIQPPISASSVKDMNYQDVELQFQKAGFTNVSAEGLGDLVTGWVHKEGEVKEVSIDGDTKYRSSNWYDPDSKVVIRYHSYPSKQSNSSASKTAANENTEQPREGLSKDGQPSEAASSEQSENKVTVAPDGGAADDGHANDNSANDEPVDNGATESNENAPAPDNAAPAPSADVPKEYKTALRSAESYSSMMHMSKAAIYDQLTSEYGEKYAPEAAQWAVDNMQADWNANALKSAHTYQDYMNMSPAAIYDQLTSEYGDKFTAEEAQYAIDNL